MNNGDTRSKIVKYKGIYEKISFLCSRILLSSFNRRGKIANEDGEKRGQLQPNFEGDVRRHVSSRYNPDTEETDAHAEYLGVGAYLGQSLVFGGVKNEQ